MIWNNKSKRICAVILVPFILLFCKIAYAAESVPSDVLEAVLSVVRIGVWYGGDEYATGSGFVIRSDNGVTYIVTNHHVIEGTPKEIVILKDDPIPLSVIASTEDKDLAILKANQKVSYKPLRLKETGAALGDAIYAAGFPSDADLLSDSIALSSLEVTLTDGIISSIKHLSPTSKSNPITVLQINADINFGNSGGPLLNSKGQVVGINTYGVSSGINGAIDVRELIDFLDAKGIAYQSGHEVGAFWIVPAVFAFGGILILIVVCVYKNKRKKNSEKSVYPKQKSTGQQTRYSPKQNNGMNTTHSSSMGRNTRIKGH